MDLETASIDELIEARSKFRQDKKWEECDIARNILDLKLVFVFDTKEGQEVYYLTDNYFNKMYNYPAKSVEKENGSLFITPAWSETKMQKIERLYNIKFDTKRKFVEWNIKNELRIEKYFEAWLFSTLSSIK